MLSAVLRKPLFVWALSFFILSSWLQIYAESPWESDPNVSYFYERNSQRTGWIVRDGYMSFRTVDAELNKDERDVRTVIQIDYMLKPFIGQATIKSERVDIHKIFFTPRFLEILEINDEVNTDFFQAKFLRREDRTNKDGITYPNCRIFEFSNIKYSAYSINPKEGSTLSEIKNLVITVAKPDTGIPFLGVAQFDFGGYLSGMPFSVGIDYIAAGPPKK